MDHLQDARDRAIDDLTSRFAEGLLSISDFEERVDAVNRADTLPTIRAAVGPPVSGAGGHSGDDGSSYRASPASRPDDDSAGQSVIAILGERKLRGGWLRDRAATSIAILGSVTLDLRDCDLGPITSIDLVSVMGETKIILPSDVAVENDVTAVLAEVGDQVGRGRLGASRTVRLKGFALMSEVKIVRG